MNKRPIKFICAIFFMTFILFSLTACNPYENYTVDEHMAEIAQWAQKRYIDAG